jgi:hypothetical protein
VAIDPRDCAREKITEPKAVVALFADLLLQSDVDADARKQLETFLADSKPQTPTRDQRVRESRSRDHDHAGYQLA